MTNVSYHLPFACTKKSSPAFTSGFAAVRSSPNSPMAALGGGGAAGAVGAAGAATGGVAGCCTVGVLHAVRAIAVTSVGALRSQCFIVGALGELRGTGQ